MRLSTYPSGVPNTATGKAIAGHSRPDLAPMSWANEEREVSLYNGETSMAVIPAGKHSLSDSSRDHFINKYAILLQTDGYASSQDR